MIFVLKSFWPTFYSQFFSVTYFQKLRLSSFQENDLFHFHSSKNFFKPGYCHITYFQKLRLSRFQENDLYWHKSAFMRTNNMSKNNSLFFLISLIFVLKCFWPTYYFQFFSLTYFQKLRLSSFLENDLYWHKSAFMRTNIFSENNSLFFSISLFFAMKVRQQEACPPLLTWVSQVLLLHSWELAFFPKTIHYFSQFH